ncbi:hypothetical protein KW785_02850, partial [Candidatus Parcubacteria bacterium]|nr:hypothetical protein [Candidatus Parcubacteria bacterium]
MIKKVSIIAVVLIFLAIGGWYFFFHQTSTPAAPVTTTQAGTPFGVAPGDVTPGSNTNNTSPFAPGTVNPVGTTANLFKISPDPVAGAVAFLRGKSEIIRYVDRATGHIYEVDPVTFTKIEIVNNTSPKIYEAIWKPDGGTVLVRSLREGSDTVVNTSLVLTPPKTTSTTSDELYAVKATELRGNMRSVVGSINTLAYVLTDTGAVTTSSFTGQSPQTIYSSAFTNWQLAWQGSNLLLTTNATAAAEGFSYLLKSGALTKVLGPLTALTANINPDGSRVVYSYLDNQNSLFTVKNLKTKTS